MSQGVLQEILPSVIRILVTFNQKHRANRKIRTTRQSAYTYTRNKVLNHAVMDVVISKSGLTVMNNPV